MTNTNPNLIPYRVMLHEEQGDKFQLVFECMAEDDDHAVEQAENAYPGCEIISYLPFDNSPLIYVIYSPNESAINDGAGFWSNQGRWTELDEASKFSHSEMKTMEMPVSTGQDARCVLFNEVRHHYGQTGTLSNSCESECMTCVGCSGGKKRVEADAEALDAFRHEVAVCIDCMLQDDARGETMVFVREGASLIPKIISADAIDLDNLQQYEMILFDGGNSAGDTWKHTFFPKQLKDHFVDENPLPQEHQTAAGNMVVSLDGGVTFRK